MEVCNFLTNEPYDKGSSKDSRALRTHLFYKIFFMTLVKPEQRHKTDVFIKSKYQR